MSNNVTPIAGGSNLHIKSFGEKLEDLVNDHAIGLTNTEVIGALNIMCTTLALEVIVPEDCDD